MNRTAFAIALIAMLAGCTHVAREQPKAQSACPELSDPFLDVSGMPPTHQNTPCFKDIKPLNWDGSEYLLINQGRGFLIYTMRNPRSVGGAIVACHLSTPCPAIQPGDYDCPLRRIAACDDCEYIILDGLAGFGGTVVTRLQSSGGPPYAGTKWLIPFTKEGGAVTYSEDGTQYVVSSRWPQGCGTVVFPAPTLWRIDGTAPPPDGATLEIQGHRSNEILYLTKIACLNMPTNQSEQVSLPNGIERPDIPSKVVMGGLRVGEYLYLTSGSATVTIWKISDEMLSFVGPAPFLGYYYDGIRLAYDQQTQLLVTGHPKVELWDMSDPTAPERVNTLDGGGSVVSFARADGRLYLWSAAIAASNASFWDVTVPTAPVEAGDDVWKVTFPHQIWMGGTMCDESLCLAGGTVVLSADLLCLEPPMIFMDGFESGYTDAWQ